MSVRWGLLSTALINEAILAAAAETSVVDVIAVASRDEERARIYADEHRLERSYGSYEGLLADTDFEAALDGGSLMDVGCYCISGLRLVAGEPARARGEQVVGPSGVDVVFTGALSFADEVVGHFDCSFVVPRRAGLEVVGEEATILVPDPFTPRTLGIDVVRPGTEPERIPIEPDNSYRLELENVSAAILGEAPLLIGREDALGQARTLDELYRSAA